MNFRWRAWQFSILVGVACLLVLASVFWWRFRSIPEVGEMIAMLPAEGATLVYVDLKSLRTAGILDLLAGNQVAEDADYRGFVAATGFDYRTDLDKVAGAIRRKDSFFVLVGRFDWSSLKQYTVNQGGKCLNGICEMPASDKGRWISFRPLRANLLALATAPYQRGAADIYLRKSPAPPDAPPQPVWVSFPQAVLTGAAVPETSKLLSKALGTARKVTFAADRARDGGFEVTLVADCPSAPEAVQLKNQLAGLTQVFKGYSASQAGKPNPGDLSAVLTSGSFEQRDSRVYGRWPVPRPFLEAVAGGNL